MDGLTFVSSVIQSLVWPITVVVAILLFRRPLSEMIRRVRELKYKAGTITFHAKLKELEEKVDAVNLPSSLPVLPNRTIGDMDISTRKMLRELAATAPRAAVSETWLQFEYKIRTAVERTDVVPPRDISQLVKTASERNVLGQDAMDLVAALYALRNQAVHEREFEIDALQAFEYIDLVERIATALGAPDRQAPEENKGG